MRCMRALLLSVTLVTPAVANAGPDQSAPLPSEIRLSDQEKERVLEEAASRNRQHAAPAAKEAVTALPPVQGEVGFTLGSDGYRSIYGGAATGTDDGFASMQFDITNFGSRNRYPDPWQLR